MGEQRPLEQVAVTGGKLRLRHGETLLTSVEPPRRSKR